MTFRKFKENAIISIVVGLIAWFVIANIVFSFRHPWATRTEQMLNVHNALMFKKIPYTEMRK